MRKKALLGIVSVVLLYTASAFSADWATSEGSCYGKGNKNISVGMSLLHFGFFGAFDYGLHDCISIGGAFGYNFYFHKYFGYEWTYHHMPIVVRGAFHPFNLKVLADKIKIRNKLDAYVGVASGWNIGWATYRESGVEPDDPNVGGFFFREYLGARFFPKENFYLFVEEGCGLGLFNLGVGFKF